MDEKPHRIDAGVIFRISDAPGHKQISDRAVSTLQGIKGSQDVNGTTKSTVSVMAMVKIL